MLYDYHAVWKRRERLGCLSRLLKTANYTGGNLIHTMICMDRHILIQRQLSFCLNLTQKGVSSSDDFMARRRDPACPLLQLTTPTSCFPDRKRDCQSCSVTISSAVACFVVNEVDIRFLQSIPRSSLDCFPTEFTNIGVKFVLTTPFSDC
jgi:hypothetical protein